MTSTTVPGANPLGYLGVIAQSPPNCIQALRNPTSTDVGYPIGTFWVNTSAEISWQLVAFSGGSAIWNDVAGATAVVSTLSDDANTQVSPSGGNIQLAGTAHQIATIAGTNKLTFSLIGPYTPATYTAHGVLLGEGTGSIVATAAGSDGQVLTGNSAADPAFAAIGTKSGLTAHGVVLGEGTSAFAATAAGSTGQVLIGASGADPAFGALGVNSNLTGLVVGNTNSAFTATTFTAAGSWTPAFSLGTPGDSAWTYSARFGRYTQIGGMVYFSAQLTWSAFSNTTGSGNWQVSLPVAAGAFTSPGSMVIYATSGVKAMPTNSIEMIGTIASAASIGVISVPTNSKVAVDGTGVAGVTNLVLANVDSTGVVTISGFYFAA